MDTDLHILSDTAARNLHDSKPSEFLAHYGQKACGLCLLPPAWVPPFFLIPVSGYLVWKAESEPGLSRYFNKPEIAILIACNTLSGEGLKRLILRSSAVHETMRDRGKYKSIILEDSTNLSAISSAAIQIYTHFAEYAEDSSLGLILQVREEATVVGHLSNETRFSPTRNRWAYESQLINQLHPGRLNSVAARPPDLERSLRCTAVREIHGQLRRVASWVNTFANRRSHLEWCIAGETLWLVQLDFEEQDRLGADPRIGPKANFPIRVEIESKFFSTLHYWCSNSLEKINQFERFRCPRAKITTRSLSL
jgi:hypothetical protein